MFNKMTLVVVLIFAGIMACKETEYIGPLNPCNLSSIPYNPTSYTVERPEGFPAMEHPADNPITEQGIELGRHLFYDPILSRDSSISCSSCHDMNKAFTDGLALAEGIDGRIGKRGSMSLINIGYSWVKGRDYNFMWDGRFATLEEQVVKGPIEDPLEMDNTWENVETDLRKHPTYPRMFREAFGIDCYEDITRELVGKAIAQFERTLNSANSKYDADQHIGGVYFTPQELRGFKLFLGDANGGAASSKDAECAHCHSFSQYKALFARNEFSNNGLDSVANFNQFLDNGYGDITGDAPENGMFREVTLRNIALTAPYMHDGRFATLEEVVDHYTTGLQPAPNLAAELSGNSLSQLDANDKADLVAFLHALTDTTYFNKPEWSSPF